MFDASTFLLTLLRSRARDLIYVVELYVHTYEPFPEPASGNLSYDPRHAVKRYAGQSISFDLDGDTVTYESEILDLSSINKHIGKKFDTASLTLSNVDRTSAAFVLNQKIAGMRMVVRMIPRSAPSGGGEASCFQHSIILYVGRVDKPDSFNRASGTISATQDLGTIAAQIPPDQFQVLCPLTKVYKVPGGDCMGNETLDQKSATYKADKLCGGTFGECTAKDNVKFYQGLRIVTLESSFIHKSNESFFKKILNILPGISRKQGPVGNSIHDGDVYGKVIPIVLGRWLMKLLPVQFQDIGTSINGKWVACRGTIKDFLNIRNESVGFTQPLGVTKHLGEYGGTGTQTADTVFPDASFHSRLAYVTLFCNGSDIETEDPAPQIVSLIAGLQVNKAFGIDGSGTGRINNVLAGYITGGLFDWTDNPVDLARFVITEPALLNIPDSHIGELATAITSAYTTGAIKDVTNAERAIFPNSEVSKAGVDYKRYNSTGLIGARSFVGLNGVPDREAIYEFDTDGSLEDGTSTLALKTVHRKRYTAGIVLNEPRKAIDFLYDTLYPSFRGFNRWDHFGRLVIDCERPADHSYLRANAAIAATSIKVLDVTRWKPIDVILNLQAPLRGKILIGAGMDRLTSEVRPVSSADYSADGNSITLAAVVTGALQVDVSGATLSGGSTVSPASGYVDILGNPQFGEQITITIDGVAVVYTATQEDQDFNTGPSLPFQLACMINAEPLLNQYIEAQYGSSPANVDTELDGSWRVLIYCKFGVLNFTTPLEQAHLAEIDDPTVAPTLASSAGALEAGAYLVSYAYRNANGNTNFSPIASITLTASKQIDVTGISLPAGADSIDWFVSVEAGSGTMLLVNNNNGSGFSINALPESTADDPPKRNTTGEEVLRVMMSFAGKALTYADTTRANVLDGSFEWPEGGKQSTINQVKGKCREAIRDFAERPIVINDDRHQAETNQTNTAEVDLSAIDNYNQAVRVGNLVLAKLRDGDFFYKWGSAGEATLLEIGDVVCASDDSGEWRNVPVRVEDILYNPRFEVFFDARLYSTSQFDDAVLQTEVPLPSALINFKAPPPDIVFNEAEFSPDGLEQSTDGTAGITSIRGGGIVGDSIYSQKVNVRLIKRGGVTVSESIAAGLIPNDDGEITFEFVASADGLYTVELEVCNQWGCNTTKPTADIIVGLGAAQGLWINPMVQLSGAGEVFTAGAGSYTIPMIVESGAGEPEPAGGGNFDIP